MSFWDKVKDFVGIESEYYDDEDNFYEDYDKYEDSKNDEKEEVIETKEEIKANDSEVKTDVVKSGREERFSKRPAVQSSISRGSSSNMIVSIREPLTYEDGKLVVDDITSGKSVVLNLEMLEVDKKTQIFYFVSGGVYALNGTIQNVTKDIYVIAPNGINIDGAIKEQITNRSLYQL
ncbi:cell division protein SepF [Peptoniphilaceae bacterium SGI.131]